MAKKNKNSVLVVLERMLEKEGAAYFSTTHDELTGAISPSHFLESEEIQGLIKRYPHLEKSFIKHVNEKTKQFEVGPYCWTYITKEEWDEGINDEEK